MTESIAGLGSSSPAQSTSRTDLAENFEMFLSLLTSQMKNQDPLNPMDSTQFVSQLVDFSSVEQQIAQNQNLESLLTLQSAMAQTSAVGFIGRVATSNTPQAALAGGEANWTYEMPSDATTSSILVRDESGRIVARGTGELTTGSHAFTWNGLDENGSQLPDGSYTLEINAANSDGNAVTPAIQASARVTGVDLSGSEVILEMGGLRVPLASILSLREAS